MDRGDGAIAWVSLSGRWSAVRHPCCHAVRKPERNCSNVGKGRHRHFGEGRFVGDFDEFLLSRTNLL